MKTVSRRVRGRWRYLLIAVLVTVVTLLTPPVIAATGLPPVVQAVDPASLERQGRTAYGQGDYEAAVQALTAALAAYEGQLLAQARIAAYLSLAHQQLGQWNLARTAVEEAQERLAAATVDDRAAVQGQVYETRARLSLAQGQLTLASQEFEQAAVAYDQAGLTDDASGRSRLGQIQALQAAGYHERAQRLAVALLDTLDPAPSPLRAEILRVYGDGLRLRGGPYLEAARDPLEASLAMAAALTLNTSAAYRSLGALEQALGNTEAALESYRLAGETATSDRGSLTVQVGQIPLQVEQQQWPLLTAALPTLTEQVWALGSGREALYLQLTLDRYLLELRANLDDRLVAQEQAAGESEAVAALDEELVALAAVLPPGDAIASNLLAVYDGAVRLGEDRAAAYALGYLGRLYAQTQQWEVAQTQTQAAVRLARVNNLPEVAYLFQEQLCLVSSQLGDRSAALDACGAAVQTTQELRADLASQGSNAEFDFQQDVQPIYRSYVSLLLQNEEAEPSSEDLKTARDVIESLQLAELDNFFREACLDTRAADIESLDQTAAVVYPIILSDRIEVILSLPNQPLRHYSTRVPEAEVNAALRQLQRSISDTRFSITASGPGLNVQSRARQVYDWLLAEADADLQAADIETLVFVLDGNLRNVPMAVLFDGERYLIEKYAVALTPGLQLLNPRPLAEQPLNALVAGVSLGQELRDTTWKPLPAVNDEVSTVRQQVGGKVLLNESVTNENLAEAIGTSDFPIVHIATHGTFSSDLDDTFLVTWNDTLSVEELAQLLQTSELSRDREIELLVLSACETAAGDDRAILGLAGIATRSGARSTLATLWPVFDDSTASLMGEFYQQIEQVSISKAKALQQAQIALLSSGDYAHPYYWSPFVLVGNWL